MSLRAETRPEDDHRTLPGAHVYLQRSSVASSSLLHSSFSFSSLYPLVHASVLRGFCDSWVLLSSIHYLFLPWSKPCPFSECCGGAGEAGVVVPSACLQTHTSVTDRTSLSLDTRNLRISARCSVCCFHHPSNPGRYRDGGAGDRQIVSAGAPGCWSGQPLQSGTGQSAEWPALPADVPCTLRAPACRALAGHLASLNRHLTERKGQGHCQTPGSPHNRLCSPC